MKKSNIVTPTLIFLMVILLSITVYFNLFYQPLQTKIDSISLQNDLLKNQRMELEFALNDMNGIRSDIRDMRDILEKNKEMILLDGSMLADDITANASQIGVSLDSITIGDPQSAGAASGSKALLFIPAVLNFSASYDTGTSFVHEFESSPTGAYKVVSINIAESKTGGQFLWQITLFLYYFGDPETVPKEEAQSEAATSGALSGGDLLKWAQ